jgi:hypothetical protein
MAKPGLTRTYQATTALTARRLVRAGAVDKFVTLAIDGSVPIIGVTEQLPAVINGPIDVIQSDIAMVEAGAAVPLSSPLTADALGRGIVGAPAAGVNMWIVGITQEAATAAGDLIRVLVLPQRIQG